MADLSDKENSEKLSGKTNEASAEPEKNELTQEEIEHRTFLIVCEKLREYEKKRLNYRKYGTLFIIVSAFVFLALMFSLNMKVMFLILWIVTIVFCVALMLRTDYIYDMYYRMVNAKRSPQNEKDGDEQETEEEEEE